MKTTDRVLTEFLRAVILRMKALGLNHTTLAARLKVARPYVTKVLHGDVNISFGAACRLAKALEMDFIPMLAPRAAKEPPKTGAEGLGTRPAASAIPSRKRSALASSAATTLCANSTLSPKEDRA